MAYVAFVISIGIVIVLSGWLRGAQKSHGTFWLLLGVSALLYSLVPQFGFTMLSEATYAGYAKGVEITIFDVAVCSYLLAQRGTTTFKTPFRNAMIPYFLVVVFSIPFALHWRAGLFYAIQLLRMYAVYRAVTIATMDEKNYASFMRGLSIGAVIELLIVMNQRFIGGDIQPDGTFGHQNSLGLVTNLLLISSTSMVLGGERSLNRWVIAGPSLLISALTGSRGVTGFALMGIIMTYFQSLYHGASSRKVKIGAVGALLAVVLVPVAILQLQQRFDREAELNIGDEEEYDERAAYVEAAKMMLADRPFGVGANNFVLVANVNGYYRAAKVAPVFNSLNGHVHNVYWLTLGELGYPGFAALLALFFVPIYKGLAAARKYRGRREAEVAGGLAIALAICYAHSMYEWLLMNANAQYFVAIVLGLMASRILVASGAGAAVPAETTAFVPQPLPSKPAIPGPLRPPVGVGARRAIPRGLHRN
jgi:O-antigen ligase